MDEIIYIYQLLCFRMVVRQCWHRRIQPMLLAMKRVTNRCSKTMILTTMVHHHRQWQRVRISHNRIEQMTPIVSCFIQPIRLLHSLHNNTIDRRAYHHLHRRSCLIRCKPPLWSQLMYVSRNVVYLLPVFITDPSTYRMHGRRVGIESTVFDTG